jgi:NhaP-type Na+/H+ or K+/H+ antiporter
VAPAQLVQAGGGLGAVIAVATFGLATPILQGLGHDDGLRRAGIAGLEMMLAAGTAVLLGTGARLLLHQTAGRAAESLVITLSLVFLCSGFANELGFSPLVSGMLAGLVIANLRDPHLRDLERGLQSAEPGMAVLMLLSCGSLAADANLSEAIPLGIAIAGLRLLVKPIIARWELRRSFPDLDRTEPLFLGPARLPMITVAIAVGSILGSEGGSEGGPEATVLAAIMIALLLGAIAPAIAARRHSGGETAPAEATA